MKKDLTIVKVGTGVISNGKRTRLDTRAINSIGKDIASIEGLTSLNQRAKRLEHEGSLILVTSGAVTAGKQKLGLDRKVFRDVRMKQTAAMIGNNLLFKLWEDATGILVGSDLLTQNDLTDREHWDNLSGVVANNLKYGVLNAFNEGDARSTEELQRKINSNGREYKRFGDNDQLASKLAIQLGNFAMSFVSQPTRVIFLTDTDGVRQDVKNTESRFKQLHSDELNEVILNCIETEGISNGGMLSKMLAAKDLTANGINVSIGYGKEEHALRRLYDYEDYGTHILANN
ncbi:hypothetical protein KDA11_06820 [Candidatus Saccharibacteria bacterium]|nr:hypothetical protein [Candidatus Saccharibacteria bacterium]